MRLFVGGLSSSVDDERLRAVFESFGEVTEAKVITDKETNRSKGFGFIAFKRTDNCLAALDEMNGADIDGRRVTVNEASARKTPERSSRPIRPELLTPEITRRPSSARREDSNEGGVSPSGHRPKNRKSQTPPPESMFVERVVRPVRPVEDDLD